MNKRDIDIDPRSIAVDFFRKLGGMDGMTKWGKTHRSLAYNLIAKLLAQPQVQNNVAVNVIHDGEAARRKLEDAFLQLIESRKYEGVDPAVFINNQRIIDHQPQPADPRPQPGQRVSDTPLSSSSVTANESPSADEPRPATADTRSQPPNSPPRPVQFSVPGQGAGAALDGGADNRSTTQKYLDWSGHGKLF
jgi:hypothetical protein